MVFRKVNMQWMCSFCSATGVKLCRRIFSIYYERLFFFSVMTELSCAPLTFYHVCRLPFYAKNRTNACSIPVAIDRLTHSLKIISTFICMLFPVSPAYLRTFFSESKQSFWSEIYFILMTHSCREFLFKNTIFFIILFVCQSLCDVICMGNIIEIHSHVSFSYLCFFRILSFSLFSVSMNRADNGSDIEIQRTPNFQLKISH